MWEWHALGPHPAERIPQRRPDGQLSWDYVHINSVDPGPAGDVLLSAAQHLDDLRRRHAQRRRSSGASAAAHSSFKLGPGDPLLLAARRRIPAGRADLGVRQRRPIRPRRSSRAACCCAPNLTDPHGEPRQSSSSTPAERCWPPARATSLSLPGGNWLMGYGGLPELHRVQLLRPGPARRHARAERAGLPDLPRALERGRPKSPPAVVAKRRRGRA